MHKQKSVHRNQNLEKLGNVVVNNTTNVSERIQGKSDKSDKIICEIHNLNTSNKKTHGISVNTEIKKGEKSSCNGESDFTHDRNIGVILYLLCGFIIKNTNYKYCGDDIYLCENSSMKRVVVSNLVIKCCKCDHTADVMTSNITRSRARDDNNHFVYSLRSFAKAEMYLMCSDEYFPSLQQVLVFIIRILVHTWPKRLNPPFSRHLDKL